MTTQDLPAHDTAPQDVPAHGVPAQGLSTQGTSKQDLPAQGTLPQGPHNLGASPSDTTGPYDDIINLPHHESATHPRMSRENRAAQFAPFAALTGHDAAVKETARLTEQRRELDENILALLDMKLALLRDSMAEHPEITVTYFKQDGKKEGGVYLTTTQILKKIDDYEHALILEGEEMIPISDIFDIEGELFKGGFL